VAQPHYQYFSLLYYYCDYDYDYYYDYYYYYYYYFCLTAIFPGESGSAGSPLFPSPPVVEKNLWGLVEWVFFTNRISFLPPNHQ